MRQAGAVQSTIASRRRKIISDVVKKILRRREEQVKHLRFKVQTTWIWIQLSSQLNPNRLERVLSQKSSDLKHFKTAGACPAVRSFGDVNSHCLIACLRIRRTTP